MREQGSHRQRGTADLFFQMSIGPFHISNELDRGASERLEGYPRRELGSKRKVPPSPQFSFIIKNVRGDRHAPRLQGVCMMHKIHACLSISILSKQRITFWKCKMIAESTETKDVHSIVLATLPKFPALCSILCSALIIRKVYFSPSKRSNIYHRIICGLSCADILASLAFFFGTWLVPANTVGGFGPVYGAIGNDATCSLSGFFAQFAVASTLYNGTLTWFYLLTIYFSWSNRKLRKIEKWFHIIPFGFALLTASIAAGLDMYGNVEWLCWIKPDISDGEELTDAQKNYVYFQWIFLVGPVWVTMVFVSRGFFLLHKKMRENEKKMEKYKFSTKSIKAKQDLGGVKVADGIKDAWHKNKFGSKSYLLSTPKPCAKDNEGWRELRSQSIVVSNPKPSSSVQDGEGCRKLRSKSVAALKEPIFRDIESPEEVAGSATRATLCDLGGVEKGFHTEPKSIMRDYEYDEEIHTHVMLSDENTADQKGFQADVDREEDIYEEDVMLTMEEELVIEQVAISTSKDVQSVGTQNDALDSGRMSRKVRFSIIVDNIAKHQSSGATLQDTNDLVDVSIRSGNLGPRRHERRATFRDYFAKWSFLSTTEINDVADTTAKLTSSSLKRNKKVFKSLMIVRKKMNHQCSDETLQEESHDLGYDEPIHSGNSQLNKRRATFRSSFAKWSFLSTARSCDIVAGTTELIPLTASSLKRKKKLFNNASKSRQIAVQGMLYVCAFYITWLFPTIQRIMELSGSDQYFVVQLFDTILLPLQGLLNFTIYIRPKFMALRKNSPDSGFWGALWKASYEI